MPRARARKTPPRLSRRRPFRPLPHLHWVFCEGKTEKHCLDLLRRHWRRSTVRVQVKAGVGAPALLVEAAKKKQEELRRAKSPPFTVHVVFDRDEHGHFQSSIQRARDLGISLGVSVPCFELWALLLHQDQTSALESREVQKKLKAVHPGYCHDRSPYLCLEAVLEGRQDASKRARLLAQRARESGDEFANPSTTFDLILDQIFCDP